MIVESSGATLTTLLILAALLGAALLAAREGVGWGLLWLASIGGGVSIAFLVGR